MIILYVTHIWYVKQNYNIIIIHYIIHFIHFIILNVITPNFIMEEDMDGYSVLGYNMFL